MIRIFAFLFAVLVSGHSANAACRGTDLRDHLPPSEKAWLAQQMAATPYSVGNHWVARKGSQTLHIIGTMHNGDSRMARVMRRLRPIIAQADAVYFEVTRTEMGKVKDQIQQRPEAFLLPPGRRLQQLMSPQGWEQFELFAAMSNADMETIQKMQPWALSLFLIPGGCRPFGFGLKRGLDDRIERYAARKGIPIGGLETAGTGFSALARMPLRDQVRMLENEVAFVLSDAPENATAVEAYFDESVWQAFLLEPRLAGQFIDVSTKELTRLDRAFYSNMLGWRNKLWMKTIRQIKGERVVIAVGAAHLPGNDGVMNLLKRQGYSLERAAFQ
ncbi:TraB/GumN family protein [Pseudophaeobacter sp. EL27]|uniref:TraB/GumN family protein n=1 Tax=Pseudophaeobacter sp. EL27 TaxID=2107580 RepID=UPI000EFD505A|nr:TraB/GumN family protein [Pseudophaeobacter sp. EL27]